MKIDWTIRFTDRAAKTLTGESFSFPNEPHVPAPVVGDFVYVPQVGADTPFVVTERHFILWGAEKIEFILSLDLPTASDQP